MALPHSLRALASPNFRRYYVGQAVSVVGSWVQSLALVWLAYGMSGSTWFTGLVGFLNSIPYLVLSPFAGVLGDRLDRRRILLTVLTLLFIQSIVLAILSGFRTITMGQLAALALFAGVANSFETPTRQAFFVQLLDDRKNLPNAIALNSILMNGARLVGPSIGGLVVGAWGVTACFAINAASYLFVIGALKRTHVVRAAPARAPSRPLADLADGWRYVMGFVPVRRMLFLLATVSITIGPYSSLMPAIAVKTFGEGAWLVGLFIGAVGFGAVIAAVSLARRATTRGLAKWIGASAIAAGVGSAGFCFSRSVPLSALMMALAGFGMFMAAASCNTIVQSVVDDDKRGRVMSYYTMFFIGSLPLGHLAAGALAEVVGAPLTFLAGGVLCALVGSVFAWRLPSFRAQLRTAYETRGIITATGEPPK